MKKVVVLVSALLIGGSATAEGASVEELAWMAGCWHYMGAEAGSGEQWTQPAGGTLLGVSRTIEGSVTVAHEFLLIRESEKGKIELVAYPSSQSKAIFTMTRVSAEEVVFENPAHDYPQRIIYRLVDNQLVGRVEGESKGEFRAIDFPMARASCESMTPGARIRR